MQTPTFSLSNLAGSLRQNRIRSTRQKDQTNHSPYLLLVPLIVGVSLLFFSCSDKTELGIEGKILGKMVRRLQVLMSPLVGRKATRRQPIWPASFCSVILWLAVTKLRSTRAVINLTPIGLQWSIPLLQQMQCWRRRMPKLSLALFSIKRPTNPSPMSN